MAATTMSSTSAHTMLLASPLSTSRQITSKVVAKRASLSPVNPASRTSSGTMTVGLVGATSAVPRAAQVNGKQVSVAVRHQEQLAVDTPATPVTPKVVADVAASEVDEVAARAVAVVDVEEGEARVRAKVGQRQLPQRQHLSLQRVARRLVQALICEFSEEKEVQAAKLERDFVLLSSSKDRVRWGRMVAV